MNYARIIFLSAVVAMAGCQPKGGTAGSSAAADNSPPVATVNGTPITRSFYEFYCKGIAGKPSSELTAEQRNQALDNLIRGVLVSQQATKDGVDKNPDTAAMVELTRLNVLQQAVSESYLKDRKPTEQELRAEYETQVGQLAKQEYHARHILVATEPFATKVIERLQKGEKFEDVAKRESMDSSKDSGGDLGWFTPDRMVKPFSDAVIALKPGDYTHKPVQTQYGWHVIQLVEVRDLQPPTFDSVRQRLEQVVQAKKFKAYTDDLMRSAKIDKSLGEAAAQDKKPAT
ncbi:MAG TPA: peptidylprolyl isomerase [Steroidobacteraceae bacterium]|nr:peptidylprolyl isomerase [Steroidobacteraceae bacterium]